MSHAKKGRGRGGAANSLRFPGTYVTRQKRRPKRLPAALAELNDLPLDAIVIPQPKASEPAPPVHDPLSDLGDAAIARDKLRQLLLGRDAARRDAVAARAALDRADDAVAAPGHGLDAFADLDAKLVDHEAGMRVQFSHRSRQCPARGSTFLPT